MLASLATAVVALTASAPAHVEPTIIEAPAGSRAEVGFTVEHGCEGSPTVEVAIQVPEGVEDVEAVPLDGWSATVAGDVVTWRGGPLPDHDTATFTLSAGLPVSPGATLLFPTVQTCEQGELAWIGAEAGESESENPAPRVVLTEVEPANTTSTTASTTTTTEPRPTTTTTTAPADDNDDDGLGAWPWVMGAMALFVLGGGALVVARRER